MRVIEKLQAKLRFLVPESKWGTDSNNIDNVNPNDDYDRIVDWDGGVQPTYDEVIAVTDTELANYSEDVEAENALVVNKALKTIVIWMAQKQDIPLATARDELKAIYKGLQVAK